MALNGDGKLEISGAMYGTALKEPSVSDLEAARLGFAQLLRRKRFSAHFIEAHSEDLLARARFEYTRALKRGAEIHTPAGWLINCAWRRTQNLLESQSVEPAFVSTEKAGVIVDEATATPEEAAIDSDRARRVEEAMGQLSHDQRTLIELSYFEGMSVREAGRFLGWHSSKAQRCHESALRRLQEALGVEDIDELAIEIGMAAWVSLAGSKSVGVGLPGGVEAVADAGGRAASGFWHRANELARRFLIGGVGEPSSAAAAGNAARAAGVCGAAAVACLASGVVGPGVGGVGLVAAGGAHHEHPAAVERRVAAEPAEARAEYVPSEEAAAAPVQSGGKFSGAGSAQQGAQAPSEASSEPPPTSEGQAEAEFSPFGGEAAGSGDSQPPSSPPPVQATRRVEGAPSGTSGSPSADGEFEAFK